MSGDLIPVGSLPATAAPSMVAQVQAALMELSVRLPELAGRPVVQVGAWRELRALRESVLVVIRELETMLVAECPERVNRNGRTVRDRLVLEDAGVVVEPTGTASSWADVDWPKLLSAVFDAAGVRATERGELVSAGRVAEIVSDVVGGGYMKSNQSAGTGLARYGLSRAEFARFVEGTHVGVKIVVGDGSRPAEVAKELTP